MLCLSVGGAEGKLAPSSLKISNTETFHLTLVSWDEGQSKAPGLPHSQKKKQTAAPQAT